MKALAWIPLIIGFVILIYEFTWIGKSSLAPVLIALAAAIILQSAYLLVRK